MKANTCYINLLKERGNSLYYLKEFLKNDSGDNYSRVVGFLSKNRQLREYVYNKFFPKIIKPSFPSYLNKLSLVKILLWYCNVLAAHKESICEFEEKKIQFEQLFLAGEYDKAYEVTETIRVKYGLSLWLLDCYGLMESFGLKNNKIESILDSDSLSWYKIINIKNRKSERQQQYKLRMNYMLKNLDEPSAVYYKYKLFSEMPFNNIKNTDENWRNILLQEGSHSLIDIYLVTVDCLQYYLNALANEDLNILDRHINVISKLDTPICRIMVATYKGNAIDNAPISVASKYIQLMQQGDFSKIIDLFLTWMDSYTCFNTYLYTAISALHTDYTLNTRQNYLHDEILKCIYNILKKDDTNTTWESLEELKSISRILRSFCIHKGICIFLDIESSSSVNYFYRQQITTYDDEALLLFGLDNKSVELLPYFSLFEEATFKDDELLLICTKAIERNLAVNYYETALIKMQICDLSKKSQLSSAINLFFKAYIKNPFLIAPIDITNIRSFLDDKIKKQIELELEELCYIFIDLNYKDARKPSFLNFIDSSSFNEPLEIIQKSRYDKKSIFFFLAKVCSIEMLNSLYMLFDSSDEARDYRIKICQHILADKTEYAKEIKAEMEELAKNKAMHQRLLNVDRSRVSINSRMIKEEVFDDIEYQLDDFNTQICEDISSQTKDGYVIINPQASAYARLYETYAKSFCFSQNGLDASLSTRVRHGAFSNQIFRPFNENHLIYSDNNANSFFENLFASDKVNKTLKDVLKELHEYIQEHVEYFRQHTLKVFIDERIEGAVFDYGAVATDVENLGLTVLFSVLTGSVVDTNYAIDLLHKNLINKTNKYLEKIRLHYLPELEKKLLDKLTSFSCECGKYANDAVTKKELVRKIAQCNTALQNEFKTITSWFYLSENEEWEDYKFVDLLEMCIEITKKLFSGFDKVKIEKDVNNDFVYDGKTFRNNTDIILILLNNAFLHSGFDEKPSDLRINCTVTSDSDYIYFAVENNLSDSIDISNLKRKIDKINDDYENEIYKSVNTRQEGGMGLYKIMIMLYNLMRNEYSFYMSVLEHKVRVEIKLRKELVCNEKNIVG